MHGGVSDEISTWSIGRINERVAAEIKAFDDARQFLVTRKMALPFSTLEEVMAGVATGAQRKIEEVDSARHVRQVAHDQRHRAAVVPRSGEAA